MKIRTRSIRLTAIVALLATIGRVSAQASPRLRIYYVPSGSMEKTLQINDRIFVNESAYVSSTPKNGEVALFKAPKAALLNSNTNGEDIVFVKRVVGTPGQTVELVNRKLRVNGALVSEPYTYWESTYSYDMKIVRNKVYSREWIGKNEQGLWTVNGIVAPMAEQDAISKAKPGKVPAGQYLLLGDHRSNSNDSHVFGCVPASLFRGRALIVFWPLSHRKNLVPATAKVKASPKLLKTAPR